MRTGILILATFFITLSVSATEKERLENKTNTEKVEAIGQEQEQTNTNSSKAINQQQVHVNTEMLTSFNNYYNTGSNTIITWDLIRGYNYSSMVGIVADYNTIVTTH